MVCPLMQCKHFVQDCCLIVYHPYRPLTQYFQQDLQDDELMSLSWRICNDSLRSDVCLQHPPHMIALGR